MSTLSPNHTHDNNSIMKASNSSSTTKTTTKTTTTTVNMAVAQSAKPKSAASKSAKAAAAAASANEKKNAQMHRRSRTGCYTCRLRRKKCDEGTPLCTACKHLGLTCEYKRPHWWSNNEARRQQKDHIKVIIKSKKLSEKSTSAASTSASMHHHHGHHSTSSVAGTPPGLSHSLPTSATFSDPLDRTRSASIDSHYSNFNFNSPPTSSEYGFGGAATSTSAFSTPQLHPDFMFAGSGSFAPYEVDIKTERQMFVNDVPTLHESSTSTFNTFHTPPPPGTILPAYPMDPNMVDPALAGSASAGVVGLGMTGPNGVVVGVPGGEWMEQVYSERRESSMTEETLNLHFFDFEHPQTGHAAIELNDNDKYLLDHFVQFVLPTIFPILETNQHGSVGSDLILPALQSNQCYLHCCLSIAAQHLKAVLTPEQLLAHQQSGLDLDNDIMRHRFATITALCDALPRDENHHQVLEATLGLIFFQCCVGRYDDTLPDISWHQHFQAVASLVQKLDLPAIVTGMMQPEGVPVLEGQSSPIPDQQQPPLQTPFNMTLTSWIDILGATMQGRAPTFAHTYREKHLSAPHNASLGLRELMGCEDRVMYLISEIACLEALKAGGMDDIMLCQHVSVLGDQIGLTELGETQPKLPFNANGTLSPAQLSKNMTAAFRLAARVYLCSLVPGFNPAQSSCVGLVEKLTAVLQTIPCGPAGFDRSVVWVYLMAGASSMPGSSFRELFEDRVNQMGEAAYVGSFGRVVSLLREVWQQQSILQSQSQTTQNEGASTEQPSSPQSVGSPLGGETQAYVHWRDVMQLKGWDFLLI
ncbi:transcriptional regulatory protein pro-1 [Ophiostoma piceae UAMH 11346]|uniref:Transcriptional regulatory protein pro-1 n=1 Tax=Ophiostoma piceae (strain UAMH 11346) TaxID=1262450 RepID=S3CKR9_OPHP1|nr:transcriptional regulatory protein pro-1 [Ophiostoma piceae UAMH 11346]